MISRISTRSMAAVLLMVSMCAGCTTVSPKVESSPQPEPKIVKMPIVVTPKHRDLIPKDARIVIADIAGPCADEVKTAIMKRLVDNADYSVVTRDNLEQIIGETTKSWAGQFNTETAAKLGRLMGASLWIVGRVAHCGQSVSDDPDNKFKTEYKIIAVLQLIDIETGKVLVASASEGVYIPQPMVPLDLKQTKLVAGAAKDSANASAQSAPGTASSGGTGGPGPDAVAPAETGRGVGELPTAAPKRTGWGPFDRLVTRTMSNQPTTTVRLPDGSKAEAFSESEAYAIMRAADEMASGFADKFFGRPLWDDVVMWDHPRWRYSEAAAFVQLGQCPLAVRLMDEEASQELPPMTEEEIAQYLHNFGVALLCANEPARAAEKLRSAYRIWPNLTTLNMLGLAGKIVEWSLVVEVDRQPEVEMLIERDLTPRGGELQPSASPDPGAPGAAAADGRRDAPADSAGEVSQGDGHQGV